MPPSVATLQALAAVDVHAEPDSPLGDRVFWRVGGPADALVTADDVPTLQRVQRVASDTGTPVFVLGRGSNLLVSDAGIRGIVVVLGGALRDATADDAHPPVVTAGAGAPLTVVLARAREHGWTGLECFAGIPGTVGGAVVMNAGSVLGETIEPLLDVDVVLADGTLRTLPKAALNMRYRHAELPPGAIVARARLQTTGADAAASQERVRAFMAKRKATQPLDQPSCGSTFRNPPGDHAGRLIEAAGLKGATLGGAQVSEKHANFLVNLGTATAADLRALIERVQDTVADRFGVHLEPEVHFAGEWGDWQRRRVA